MLALEMDLALELNSEVALVVDLLVDLLVDLVDLRVTLEVDSAKNGEDHSMAEQLHATLDRNLVLNQSVFFSQATK